MPPPKIVFLSIHRLNLSLIVPLLFSVGCDRPETLDSITLPLKQTINVMRPESATTIDTERTFFGRIVSAPQQQGLLLAVPLPTRISKQLTIGQQVVATKGKEEIVCPLIGVAQRDGPPGSRSARFAIDPAQLPKGWSAGDSISVVMKLTNEADGVWVPISALGQNAKSEWAVFAVQPVGESDDEFRIKSITVEVVHHHQDQVLIRPSGDIELIARDGTHRIVAGQKVTITKNLKEGLEDKAVSETESDTTQDSESVIPASSEPSK